LLEIYLREDGLEAAPTEIPYLLARVSETLIPSSPPERLQIIRMSELLIIQKTYDFVKWYIPILNRLPQSHKFLLGQRIINELYDLLEGLVTVQYSRSKLSSLEMLNNKLNILRYQARLLRDFDLVSVDRYEDIGESLQDIGSNLGAWIKQQKSLSLK